MNFYLSSTNYRYRILLLIYFRRKFQIHVLNYCFLSTHPADRIFSCLHIYIYILLLYKSLQVFTSLKFMNLLQQPTHVDCIVAKTRINIPSDVIRWVIGNTFIGVVVKLKYCSELFRLKLIHNGVYTYKPRRLRLCILNNVIVYRTIKWFTFDQTVYCTRG